jgi:hypothetical protein
MRPLVVALFLAGAAIAYALVIGQAPFAASAFEFGQYREYTGSLEEWPYPMLATADARYLLAAPGKHGQDIAGLSGRRVRLKGALIRRGEDQMLEVQPGSIHATDGAGAPTETIDLGPVRLTGEIVDTKCYLGVMNPGEGKVHRDCAVRCISGGAPPAFVARDASGEVRMMLLVGSDGRALRKEVLDFVAEPVRVAGRLARHGATLVLRAEPSDFRRE